MFEDTWNIERKSNKKLQFYNSVKTSFETETYLGIHMGNKELKRLAQFRTSTHKYRIETGRYGNVQDRSLSRICNICSTEDKDTLLMLSECPFFDPIVENEEHVLKECPFYKELRLSLKKETKFLINTNTGIQRIFKNKPLLRDLGNFIKRCHDLKFPKITLTKAKSTTTSKAEKTTPPA